MKAGWWLKIVALLLFAATAMAGEAITLGERQQFMSKQLGEQVSYSVALPPSYATQTSRKYPLLLVLDAQQQFAHVASSVAFLSGYGDLPEMIVVGIDSNNRLRDYTPTDWADMNGADGGAPKFKRFLADEFMPRIERDYRSDSYRMLYGHSLGGLFALYTLIDEPSLFRAYLVTSPTVDWDRGYARRSIEAGFGKAIAAPTFLYLAHSDDRGQALQDFKDLVAAVGKQAPKTLRLHSSGYPDEMHVTIPLLASVDALRQLFDGYRLHPDQHGRGIAYAEQHFAELSKRLGHPLPMPEQTANDLGYAALESGRTDEAIALFEHNVRDFPDSPNAADSLADAYAKAERWQDAAASAARAVKLGEAQHDRNLEHFRGQLQRFSDAAKAAGTAAD